MPQLLVLGYWVGVRCLFHLTLLPTASHMALPQDPSTDQIRSSQANITKGCPPPPPSGLRFSNVFQSAMVLQRDEPLTLFGFGAGGGSAAVEVTLCEQQPGMLQCAAGAASHTANATLTSAGKWTASMPAQPGGVAPMLLSVGSADQPAHQLLQDVVFGDVYLFSGPSSTTTILG